MKWDRMELSYRMLNVANVHSPSLTCASANKATDNRATNHANRFHVCMQ